MYSFTFFIASGIRPGIFRHFVNGSFVNKGVLLFGGLVENGIMQEKVFGDGYTNDSDICEAIL